MAILTFGSKLTVDENRKAARPSLKTTAYPPIRGEQAILATKTPLSDNGTALKNKKKTLKKAFTNTKFDL